ncbi:MAG: hypothetical protein RBS43_09330, partial [Candidatus Cloacimonas sp.]|nr:hypothetical protein [Candidatus Cloacimonas sp.]
SDGAFSLGESSNDEEGFICSATGFEGQLLFSGNASAKDTYTFAVRMNYHSYQETYLGTPYGPVDVMHGAISTNLKSKMRRLYIMPEIGIGIFPVVNGKTYIVGPFLSFGVGYQ